MTYLPPGCTPPDPTELDSFWTHARQTLPAANLPPHYSVRWIGLNNESTEQVLDLIRAGDKTGTYTLPWIVEHTTHPTPAVGDAIILIDFGGHPRLIVRLTEIEQVTFGAVTTTHTGVDGTPMRDLAVWKPLHTNYWNAMLAEHDLAVSDAMPVWVEKFELLN